MTFALFECFEDISSTDNKQLKQSISITFNKRVFHLVNFGTEIQTLDLIERGKTDHFKQSQEYLIVLIRET